MDCNMKRLFFKILSKIYVCVILIILRFYKIKLVLFKIIKGIKTPIIHVYTVCWNEEKFLPFFIKHYGSFCDKIIVYDNESTDSTLNILAKNQKVSVITYKTGNKINDSEYQRIKNTAWKHSRGKADYVIVCDTDELLYDKNDNIKNTLQMSRNTIFHPEGYEMISEYFPSYDKPLREQCKGVPSKYYCKKIIFDPHCIVNINYYPGCHEADPRGYVKTGTSEFLLLHFKRIGVEYIINRYHTFKERLSKQNIENEMGMHYFMTEQEITDEFNRMFAAAKPV